MMRKGFALLEVMFALLIGSMIALILFESLSQAQGVLSRVTSISSMERKVVLMRQQFENDFSGIFPPHIMEKPDDEEEMTSEKKEQSAPERRSGEKQENAFKTFTFESDERGLVKILSFVTTNPLPIYLQPLPRAVRVAYRVIVDPENEGKLLLVRQESDELSLKKFEAATKKETIKEGQKPIRSYEIARDIESIKFEFYLEKREKKQQPQQGQPEPKKAEPEKKKEEEEKPREYMLIDAWKKLPEEQRAKYEAPEIPSFCCMKIFLNDEKKRTHNFEFWFFSCAGVRPVEVKGVSSLPTAQELQQRKAGQAETDRIYLYNGIPQYGRDK